jgi:hypothetical protein
MNTTPIWPSNKNQWQGAKEDPKQKQDRAKDTCIPCVCCISFAIIACFDYLSNKQFLDLLTSEWVYAYKTFANNVSNTKAFEQCLKLADGN